MLVIVIRNKQILIGCFLYFAKRSSNYIRFFTLVYVTVKSIDVMHYFNKNLA